MQLQTPTVFYMRQSVPDAGSLLSQQHTGVGKHISPRNFLPTAGARALLLLLQGIDVGGKQAQFLKIF
jgi:hypothetical protein